MNKKKRACSQKELTKGCNEILKYRKALEEVCNHLRYISCALIEQSTGNPERLRNWSSENTLEVIQNAEKILRS